MDELLSTTQGPVTTLTLNRPDRMNALGRELVRALNRRLRELNDEDQTRVIIIKATGRAFCAGADLKERADMDPRETAAFVAHLRDTFALLYDHEKVTIASIQGAALGGGLELALSCDLRYASISAKLGLTETRLAIIPGAGGTQLLPRVIGPARAKEMIFRAAPVNADGAERMGLIHHAVPDADLDAHVVKVAETIAANGPIALRMAKRAIHLGIESSLQQGLEAERLCYAQVIPTEDRLEGLRAFREKRPPEYKGR